MIALHTVIAIVVIILLICDVDYLPLNLRGRAGCAGLSSGALNRAFHRLTGLPHMAGALGTGIFAGYVFVLPGLAAVSIAGLLNIPLRLQ